MGITHTTPADLTFTPRGKIAWEEAHTIDESLDITISTDTAKSRFYRADATFSGTVDPGTFIGYNITGFGQIADAAKASVAIGMEGNFNTGVFLSSEFHVDMAGPGQSYARPFAAYYAHTGANANKIYDLQVLSSVGMTISASATGTMTLTAQTFTVGTSGASFNMTGNLTGSAKLLLVAVTDTDSSSIIQLGVGGSAANSRTNILFRPGGFAAAANANALSDGDKLVFWNDSSVKAAAGIDNNGKLFLQNHRPSGSATAASFVWTGGIAASTTELMRLDGNGDFFTRSTGTELGTTTTTGFAHIPSCNGAPSGVPATILTGAVPMIWDRANLQLYIYTGAAWKKSAAFT